MSTSLTLLGRLRENPTDQSAWDEFVGRYTPVILHWCRRWGLQTADAEEVCQNVLHELWRQMRTFVRRPGGRFRNWLHTVVRRAWCDLLAARLKGPTVGGDALRSAEACEDLVRQVEAEDERELMSRAMDQVRLGVESHTWEAFWLTAVEGLRGEEVSRRLGMSIGNVYKAKSRVTQQVRAEVSKLEQGERA